MPTVTRSRTKNLPFTHVMVLARKYDKEALSALYELALPPVYRYVVARVGTDLAEDVISDIFLEMVESIGTVRADHEAGFFAWIFQIAYTKILRARKQAAQYQAMQTTLPDFAFSDSGVHSGKELTATDLASDPVAFQEWSEVLTELGIALGTLTREQQYVIVGRFLAGQSIEDLARAMERQPGAIRALQFRALGTLAERMNLRHRHREEHKKGDRA
jgi:RNA polymerase sigma-70 factor, ECF subfamily